MNSADFLKIATPGMIDTMNAEANRMAADLAAARAENARLRELLNALCDRTEYLIGGGYIGIMKREQAVQPVRDTIKTARAALDAAPAGA